MVFLKWIRTHTVERFFYLIFLSPITSNNIFILFWFAEAFLQSTQQKMICLMPDRTEGLQKCHAAGSH